MHCDVFDRLQKEREDGEATREFRERHTTGNSSEDGAGWEDRTQESTDRIRDRANEIWEAEGRPEGRHDEHWLQAEHEIIHGMDELSGDDVPNLAALREAAREHADSFLVKSDLEDPDQRDAAPGVREQPP